MIRYIKQSEIDKKRWDHCISNAVNSKIYAYSWYLDLVTNTQWDALIDDEYSTVFPLPFRKKAGISYLYTPIFIQQLGIFYEQAPTNEMLQSLLQAVPMNFKLIDLNFNTGNNLQKVATEAGFRMTMKSNYELSLHEPYDHLRKKYSENLRRNIKKAKEKGLVISNVQSPIAIIDLFRMERGKKISRWKDNEYSLFEQLCQKVNTEANLKILEARLSDGTFVAGAVFFIINGRAIFIFSATGEQAKSTGAMSGLIDCFIADHSDQAIVLDFEGSSDPGLARYYSSFGSERLEYPHIFRDQLPLAVQLARFLKQSR